MQGIISILLMFVIFYFLLIRSQNKKEKQIRDMRANLKKGDEIITIGGIYGKIFNIHDDVLTIVVGKDNLKIKIARWAVADIVNKENKSENNASKEEEKQELLQDQKESLQKQNNKE
ncbi:preprotein translocase subunit YajC [Garciella nitratireducens]|uniref:preprotein translocase subunit YajC n=1 Tax=Garciella nitratireducens TaxID=218205 RepID=UPI001BD660D7|nr:preprotein translocase subunit YajC [Garciella nitratireducens]